MRIDASTVFVIGFLVLVGVHRLLETFARRGTIPGQQQMQWSFYAFFILHTLIMVTALAEYLLRREPLHVAACGAGLVLYGVALVLRNVAIRTLGRFWSLQVEIRAEHRLIREGVYNYVRHPAYSAICLEVLAIPLAVNAWWTMLFAAVTYIPLLLWRLRWEERALVTKFGNDYVVYQREVGALVPRLGRVRPGPGAA